MTAVVVRRTRRLRAPVGELVAVYEEAETEEAAPDRRWEDAARMQLAMAGISLRP